MELEEEDDSIKIIVIGDTGVGKTNLINTSIGISFLDNNTTSVSSSFVSKQFIINNKKYNINLWDTAGQEKYKSITKLFLKGSEIVILVYDITRSSTFDSLDSWYSICEKNLGNQVIYGVVGNKFDLFVQEEVLEEDARKFAEQIKAKFKLVSAKDCPGEFVKFIKDLVIEYIGLNKINRVDSTTLKKEEYFAHKNNKKKSCDC